MPTVNAQNWTTLYSATAQQITPQQPYGNANVEHFLNVGTDGGNTVENILANGTIYANGNIEANGFFVGDGGYLSNITAYSNVIANTANFANFAGNVTNSAQPNITSVGTLTSLTVSGNSNLANINVSGGIVFANNNVSPDILVANNASNTLTRGMIIQAGNINSPTTASNQTAGSLRMQAGNSDGTSSSTTWIARGGSQILAAGYANSNIGNAIGGAYNIFAGDGTSLLTGNTTGGLLGIYAGGATANAGNANGGAIQYYGGGAYTETGNSIGGNIDILAGPATSNTSGNATAGSINIDTQTATGVTSSTQGNINIGTGNAVAINIGSSSATIYANTGIEVAPNVGIHTVFDGGGTYPEHIMWRSNTYIGGGPEGTAQWQPVTSRGSLASPTTIGDNDTILKFETAVNTGTTTPYGPYTGYSYGPTLRAINTFNPGVDPDPVGFAYSYGNFQFATAGNLNSNDYVLRTDLGPNGISVYGFVPTNGFAAADTRFDINLSDGSSYNPTVTAGSFTGDGNLTVANTVVAPNLQIGNSAANTVSFTTNSVGANLVTLDGNKYVYNTRESFTTDPVSNLFTADAVVMPYDTVNAQGQFYRINYLAKDLANTSNIAVLGAQDFYPLSYTPGNEAVVGYYSLSMFHGGSDLANADANTGTAYEIGNPGLNFLVGAPHTAAAGTPIISTTSYGRSANAVESVAMRFTRRRGNGVARLSLQPNDYLGNIEWRGSQAGGAAPAGSRWPKIAPQVDSSYVANTAAVPAGINFIVCDNTTNYTHTFYANGNVSFSGNVAMGNLATANYFQGDGSLLTNINSQAIAANYLDSNYTATIGAITANTIYGVPVTSLSATNITIATGTIAIDNATATGPTRITFGKTGRYNLQFSIQLENTDNASDHLFDIWLRKNGSDVAETNTQYTVVKNNGKNVAALNLLLNPTVVNDYYELVYAVSDAAVGIKTIAAQTTPFVRPLTPGIIVTVVPVGA